MPSGKDTWTLFRTHDFNFTTPQTTPPGKYFMRIEHIHPISMFNYSECAHVNIMGPGEGTPTGFAQFPGTYEITDPGIHIPRNQEVSQEPRADDDIELLGYNPPGPAVWTG